MAEGTQASRALSLSRLALSVLFFPPRLVKMMQTQRSNYGRKPTSISI